MLKDSIAFGQSFPSVRNSGDCFHLSLLGTCGADLLPGSLLDHLGRLIAIDHGMCSMQGLQFVRSEL